MGDIDPNTLFKVFFFLVMALGALGSVVGKFLKVPGNNQQPGRGGQRGPGGAGREVQEFLETLRKEQARQEEAAGRLPSPAAAQEARRRSTLDEADDGWTDYEWEPIEPEPRPAPQRPRQPVQPQRSQLQRQPTPPRQTYTALTRPMAVASSETQQTDSSALSPAVTPGRPEDEPRWLALSEIVAPGGSSKIRGVPIARAFAVREVLGPPRALRPWRPGGGRERGDGRA